MDCPENRKERKNRTMDLPGPSLKPTPVIEEFNVTVVNQTYIKLSNILRKHFHNKKQMELSLNLLE